MLTPGSRSSVRKIFKFCQHNGQAFIKEAALHTSCIIRLRIFWGIQIRKSRHFIITMARLMLLLLLIVLLILTSTAESGQKVIQFKILRFHQDSFSLTLPKLNVVPLISALNILSYGVLWAIDGYTSFTRRSQRSKTWLAWCEHHGRWNSCTAKVWLHGWVVIQLGDAILDLLKWCSTNKQMVKPS